MGEQEKLGSKCGAGVSEKFQISGMHRLWCLSLCVGGLEGDSRSFLHDRRKCWEHPRKLLLTSKKIANHHCCCRRNLGAAGVGDSISG